MQGLHHQLGKNHRTKNSHACRKLLKCWYKGNVTDIVFFKVCGKYVFLVLSKRWIWNIKYAKKEITSGMEWADLAAFTFAAPDKWDRCYCKFISRTATVINLFAILRVFLVGLAIWSEFFGCFSKRVKSFEEKLNICLGKQELARTCSVWSMLGEKPNHSKISRG